MADFFAAGAFKYGIAIFCETGITGGVSLDADILGHEGVKAASRFGGPSFNS